MHERTDPWRPGAYSSDGNHGPERLRTVAQEILLRSWTHCLDCGTRLERAMLQASEDK